MLEFFSAHLRLHLFIGIFLVRWRIEAKALGSFAFEFKLQPLHISFGIKCFPTASGEELGVRLVSVLLRLKCLVVKPRHHLTPSELDAGRSSSLEVERAFDATWTDEAPQLFREAVQRWCIPPLPVNMDIRA
jgi:hypothetical protein